MSGDEMKVPFLDLGAMHSELRGELDRLWGEVVDTSSFIAGPHAERFEGLWADYCGVKHAIGVANGTDSIELILRGMAIGAGDEVIIPANTFIATAEAAVACGATPVFVDVDPETLLVTADLIASAITARTAAVIPVHLYGQPCQMDAINELASIKGIAVIEDSAQAHGARWAGGVAGSLGDAASFSFYPGKNLGAFGDAGAVVTNDDALAARVRSLSNHGRADGHHVLHPMMGRNSRLDGIQAAVLSTKIPLLDHWNDQRRVAHGQYKTRLESSVATMVAEHPDAHSVWHLNVVQVPNRDSVLEAMTDRGIDVRIHYPHPCHRHNSLTNQPTLPVVEAATPQLLSLPMFPTITTEQIDLVCHTLDSVLADQESFAGEIDVTERAAASAAT